MVQQLRALAILAKDWCLFPAPTTRFTNICSSNFWGSNALFRTQKVHTHTCRKNTQVNKVNLKKCLKKKKRTIFLTPSMRDGVVTHTCNLITLKADTGESL